MQDLEETKKTRESEYAGYLYPSVFRSLPIAAIQSETMIRTALTTLHISTIRTQRIIWEAPVPAVISTSIMEMYCSFL